MRKLGLMVAVVFFGVGMGVSALAGSNKHQLYGSVPLTASSEVTNVKGLVMAKDGKPFTGRVKYVSDSGYSIWTYKDGIADGLFEVWTNKGKLKEQVMFKKGQRNGEALEYWLDTGKLKIKAHYRANKLNGVVEKYYPSGTLQMKRIFVDDLLHGEALHYSESGKLQGSIHFEHGQETGPYKIFSEKGTLVEEGGVKNGVPHGPFTVYSSQTGKPTLQGTYKMNKYDGELTMWGPNGEKVIQTYENGVANGCERTYNSQGVLEAERMIKNGQPTGECCSDQSSGK